jgi:Flp pilus assembly protein TadG
MMRTKFRSLLRDLRIVRQESGLAAVEFALILPIMVVLWFGGVELTQGLSVDRHLNNLASSIGDLVSRSKIVTNDNIDQIFDVAPGAMYPYCKTETACTSAGLGMRITAVDMNSAGTATVAWSRAQGTTAYADGAAMNSIVPATLRVPDTQIIVAEAYYTYRPAIGYVVTGNVALNDRMFFVPRLVTKIQLCQTNPPPTNCKS